MSISPDRRFHIGELDTLDEAMKHITKVFGINNELKAHQLENECLHWTPIIFLTLKIFCPSSRPLDFSWKVLRLRKKIIALSSPFLLSWDQPILCLFPPSILQEKPSFLKDKTTSPLPLMPFVIL